MNLCVNSTNFPRTFQIDTQSGSNRTSIPVHRTIPPQQQQKLINSADFPPRKHTQQMEGDLLQQCIQQCTEWIDSCQNTTSSSIKDEVSFKLLVKLVSLLQASQPIEVNAMSNSSLSLHSISSVDTMIIYEAESTSNSSSMNEASENARILNATLAVQRLWKLCQLRIHIDERRAILDSSMSCSQISSISSNKSSISIKHQPSSLHTPKQSSSSSCTWEQLQQMASEFNSQENEPALFTSGSSSYTPANIVHLWKKGLLDCKVFGEWIGSSSNLDAEETLFLALQEFDWTNVALVEALRSFLATFTLPGEAQKIDRIINEFAKRYFSFHQQATEHSLFPNVDVVYILAFSLIMLNTDAHNFNVKSKMTLQQYKRTYRLIEDTKNTNDSAMESFLENCYRSILKREIISQAEAKEKLQRILQTTTGIPQPFSYSNASFLGAFQCVQGTTTDNWLFKRERIVLLTCSSLVLLKPNSKGEAKYECKNVRGFGRVYSTKMLSSTCIQIAFCSASSSNYALKKASVGPTNAEHNSPVEPVTFIPSSSTLEMLVLSFKLPEYLQAFYELLQESVREFIVAQAALHQQRLLACQEKASRAKMLLERAYQPILTA